MDNSDSERRNQANLIDEINDDMDSFFDLPGRLGEGTVPFKARYSESEDRCYNEILGKIGEGLNGDLERLLNKLDDVVTGRLTYTENASLLTGVVIGLRMAGMSRAKAAKIVKAWF